ncbi:unnamed protein product [Lampetra planeri]
MGLDHGALCGRREVTRVEGQRWPPVDDVAGRRRRSREALLGLSFGGALGLVLLGLACALPMYNVFWPLLVLPFHALAPVPELLWRRVGRDSDTGSSLGREITLFFIAGAVTSAFGLPIILAHASVIKWGACGLTLAGNAVLFSTVLAFFLVFGQEDDIGWSQW